MSQHFMTVCVVCVLCAAHTPCSAHTTISPAASHLPIDKIPNSHSVKSLYNRKNILASIIPQTEDRGGNNDDNYELINMSNNHKIADVKRKSTKKNFNSVKNKLVDENNEKIEFSQRKTLMDSQEVLERLGQIKKQNSGITKNNNYYFKNNKGLHRRAKRHADVEERYFLKKIFDAYGDGESLTMEGFEMMLKKLGLMQLIANFERQRSINITKNGEFNKKKKKYKIIILPSLFFN